MRLDELLADVAHEEAGPWLALARALRETFVRPDHRLVPLRGLVGDGLFPLCIGNGSDPGLGEDEADAHN